MNDTAPDTMIVPEFIQEATRRFEESPRTYQTEGADALLPPRAVETRMQARAFVATRLSQLAREIDRTNQIPEELRREIAELDYFGLTIPEAYGGRDSVLEACLVVEECSRVSAAVGLMVAVGLLASTPLVVGGDERQQQEWLPALARHAAKIAAGRQLTYHAAQLADARSPELNAAASMAKLFASDVAMEVVTDAMQFWGGAGYMVGSPVERMYRDAKIIQIYEGTNEIQELVIARAMRRAVESSAGGA